MMQFTSVIRGFFPSFVGFGRFCIRLLVSLTFGIICQTTLLMLLLGGRTTYPTGPNLTQSDLSALDIVHPAANPTTVTHSLTYVHHANTFDHRYTRNVSDNSTIVTNLL